MAQIDKLIHHLYEFAGTAIGIGVGHPVMLLSENGRQAITAEALSREQIDALILESVPKQPLKHKETEATGIHHLSYDSPYGLVHLEIHRSDDHLKLLIRPSILPKGNTSDDQSSLPQTGQVDIDELKIEMINDKKKSQLNIENNTNPESQDYLKQQQLKDSSIAVEDNQITHSKIIVEEEIQYIEPGSTATVDHFFKQMVEKKSSDLYICAGKPIIIRRDGDLTILGDTKPLSNEVVKLLLYEIIPIDERKKFEAQQDLDFTYEIPYLARFRANIFRDRHGIGGIFRQIPSRILSAEDLNLPKAILEMCHLSKGLVLVTGPTGAGKSTTLAAMIDYINKRRKSHIITIEDPIEFVHEDKSCVIHQRELKTHTKSFKDALRSALREDPDIVLIGELRDLETVSMAIETAETGHLVFATLHTNTAASTIDRLIDQFPVGQQAQIRTMLSESLRGIVAQTLCKKKNGGLIAALEILVATASVANIIREGKTFQMPSIMQTGKALGMITLADALINLIKSGEITPEEAYYKAAVKQEFRNACKRHSIPLEI